MGCGRAAPDMHSAEGQDRPPEIGLRIPGPWRSPDSLDAALPKGYRFALDRLWMPGGESVEVFPHPPDGEFPEVFTLACRGSLTKEERERVRTYEVNVCLSGRGGSVDAVRRMFRAAAAVVRAGGAGVFVDNSGAAHRPARWLEIAGCSEIRCAFLALVTVVPFRNEMGSVGMHMIGLRDAVLPRTGDRDADYETLNGFLEYCLVSGVPISDGDLVGDHAGPKYRLVREEACRFRPPSPLYNPYGQWRLELLNLESGLGGADGIH